MAMTFQAHLQQLREAEPFKEVIPTQFAESYKRRPDAKMN
jgi:hypothetical protein